MTDAPAATLACAFAKAVAAGAGRCPLVTLVAVGEAERPCCSAPVAHTNCRTLHALLRERSTFVLRLPPPSAPLPHAQDLRVQCGGLRGLAAALGDREGPTEDIHALVVRARDTFGGLLGIPFDPVVAAIARWEKRPRPARGEDAR
jgi:hypothetical protein